MKNHKMNILVILAHPDSASFNHAIAENVVNQLKSNNHDVVFHNLYAENFNPNLPSTEIPKNGKVDSEILKHCDELKNADGIVVIHPNWWGQPPAILKGWIDRVIRPGVAYEFEDGDNGEGVPVGLLNAQTAIVFNTANTGKEREENIFFDPLETIWKNCIFDLCGVKNFYRKMFRIIVTSTDQQRTRWLGEVKETIQKYFPDLKAY
ncbi:MAG: NAD(P)H-dependent oxidoreductase [Prolixibacteraceae bacterium]|nr:NAD(P)H-dependent oxidoreductase [Prolixibacteraceae bacterium]